MIAGNTRECYPIPITLREQITYSCCDVIFPSVFTFRSAHQEITRKHTSFIVISGTIRLIADVIHRLCLKKSATYQPTPATDYKNTFICHFTHRSIFIWLWNYTFVYNFIQVSAIFIIRVFDKIGAVMWSKIWKNNFFRYRKEKSLRTAPKCTFHKTKP